MVEPGRRSDQATREPPPKDAVFRQANERIEAWALGARYRGDLLPFLCECPVLSCTRPIRISRADYARIRSNPRWFITAPGHEGSVCGGIRIVERGAGYVVAEKLGPPDGA